jgi:hypothetical protein
MDDHAEEQLITTSWRQNKTFQNLLMKHSSQTRTGFVISNWGIAHVFVLHSSQKIFEQQEKSQRRTKTFPEVISKEISLLEETEELAQKCSELRADASNGLA